MSKKNKNKIKRTGVQILAIVLAALMLSGAIGTIITLLLL